MLRYEWQQNLNFVTIGQFNAKIPVHYQLSTCLPVATVVVQP